MPSPLQRIRPLTPSEWSEPVRDVFTIMEGPEAREKGSPFNAVLTLAQHPALAAAVLNFSKQLSSTMTISPRVREAVALRTAWRYQTEYEWGHHCASSRVLGFTEEHFEAIKQSADSPIWSDLERLAIRAVDQLQVTSRIDSDLWNGLAKHLSQRQMLELIYWIGHYAMTALAFNAIQLELEPAYRDPSFPSLAAT